MQVTAMAMRSPTKAVAASEDAIAKFRKSGRHLLRMNFLLYPSRGRPADRVGVAVDAALVSHSKETGIISWTFRSIFAQTGTWVSFMELVRTLIPELGAAGCVGVVFTMLFAIVPMSGVPKTTAMCMHLR